MKCYPIKFSPILQSKLWGGNKLVKKFGKKASTGEEIQIGESWELSDVKNETSVVSNGNYKGISLKELLQEYKSQLVGSLNYSIFNDNFPILIKFIDAKQDLSIQVHPNDELAFNKHQSFGKTEMWYIMEAEENAKLVLGFNELLSKEKYKSLVKNEQLESVLHYESVKKGDSFYIEAGLVHAIGAGIVLAEIQQTSDITYRIFDWNRRDNNGNLRELHTDLAGDAIKFSSKDSKRIYQEQPNQLNSIVNSKYFTTNIIPLTEKVTIDYSNLDSFIIFMCVKGDVKITCNDFTEELNYGETVLIPAIANEVILESKDAKLLEITV